MAKKNTKSIPVKSAPAPGIVKEVFTFAFNPYFFKSLAEQDSPYSFNMEVHARRYKLTLELLNEPIFVIQQRIVDLWETCSNSHHRGPLKLEAEMYGCEHLILPMAFGCRRKKEE